jgi:hypothetical protein
MCVLRHLGLKVGLTQRTRTQEFLPNKRANRPRTRVGFVRRCDPEGYRDVLDALDVVFCVQVDLDGTAGDDC